MVDFMLEYLRQDAASTTRKRFYIRMARAYRDTLVAFRCAVDTMDRETSFISTRAPTRGLYDFRIDVNLYFSRWWSRSFWYYHRGQRTVLAHDEETPRDADLWRRKRNALGFLVERLFHIANKLRELRRAEQFFGYGFRYLSQHLRSI